MTVVAGNGTSGYSGDNGPATLAELNGAQWVAVDAADNLYIADSMNNRIRKVTLGVITTIAGGYGTVGPQSNGRPTTSGQLNLPQGIATDTSGNVYIADAGSNRVFEVSHGERGIVAGNGTAGFQRRWRGGYECAVESAAGRGGGWLRERLHHRFGQQSHPQSDAGRDYYSRRERHVGVQRRRRTGNRSSVERSTGRLGDRCGRQPLYCRYVQLAHSRSFERGDHDGNGQRGLLFFGRRGSSHQHQL